MNHTYLAQKQHSRFRKRRQSRQAPRQPFQSGGVADENQGRQWRAAADRRVAGVALFKPRDEKVPGIFGQDDNKWQLTVSESG